MCAKFWVALMFENCTGGFHTHDEFQDGGASGGATNCLKIARGGGGFHAHVMIFKFQDGGASGAPTQYFRVRSTILYSVVW